jgi:hypothetical protein
MAGSKPKYKKRVTTLQGWEVSELKAAKTAAHKAEQSLTYFVRDAVKWYAEYMEDQRFGRQQKASDNFVSDPYEVIAAELDKGKHAEPRRKRRAA